ncbi:hypothetical protein BOTBODRAFT_310063 [Botryobasidium botryosum FD-172 SS1]|uniref:Uncharacterized protein n=1 Tax=Botryobasidium botryosum (strain FD-172 SS1) TaxID=930990 RepID=A0A067N0N5_BOTB1|nr:hypothetical protein BOTBODRAFT_310063 [Botryobasidium botryosum FD-172 SS1]
MARCHRKQRATERQERRIVWKFDSQRLCPPMRVPLAAFQSPYEKPNPDGAAHPNFICASRFQNCLHRVRADPICLFSSDISAPLSASPHLPQSRRVTPTPPALTLATRVHGITAVDWPDGHGCKRWVVRPAYASYPLSRSDLASHPHPRALVYPRFASPTRPDKRTFIISPHNPLTYTREIAFLFSLPSLVHETRHPFPEASRPVH